jgi:hypothetical protein
MQVDRYEVNIPHDRVEILRERVARKYTNACSSIIEDLVRVEFIRDCKGIRVPKCYEVNRGNTENTKGKGGCKQKGKEKRKESEKEYIKSEVKSVLPREIQFSGSKEKSRDRGLYGSELKESHDALNRSSRSSMESQVNKQDKGNSDSVNAFRAKKCPNDQFCIDPFCSYYHFRGEKVRTSAKTSGKLCKKPHCSQTECSDNHSIAEALSSPILNQISLNYYTIEELSEYQERIHDMLFPQSKIQDCRYRFICSVCKVREKNTALIPCGHCFCNECAEASICKEAKCGMNISGRFKVII